MYSSHGPLSTKFYSLQLRSPYDWVTEIPPPTLDSIEMVIKTTGPGNRYKFALFIEKEGFDSHFKAARIQERFDIAVMSTKGMSVTASRSLVEELSNNGVTILVAHDCDKTGFSICHTLHNDTRRYTFASQPNVHCLGLRLREAQAMGLAAESVHYQKRVRKYRLRECGATEEECDFIIGDGKDGQRIELDAMDSQQFIAWLETKFAEHGVQKVVPNKDTLEAAYKLAILRGQANAAIAKVQKAWDQNGHGHTTPEDIEELVRQTIEGTDLSWDEAINVLTRSDEQETEDSAANSSGKTKRKRRRRNDSTKLKAQEGQREQPPSGEQEHEVTDILKLFDQVLGGSTDKPTDDDE